MSARRIPINLFEYEEAAREIVSEKVFDFVSGGSEDEISLRGNRTGFDRWRFLPRSLSGSDSPKLATTVFGHQISLPVMVSPMGLHKLAHPDGELASAAGTKRAGTIFTMSVASSTAAEDVAPVAGIWWFQLYLLVDRGLTLEIVRRAERAGASAIVLTVDVPVRGRREADQRNLFEMPPGMTMPNVLPQEQSASSPAYTALTDWFRAISLRDVEWLVSETRLPVVVKGVLSSIDATQAVASGARGVIVSNHGGRQLDSTVASIDALPAVAAAIGDRAEIYLDGGIRRGTDVLKALALGANAVMIGRPILYGLACGGEEGVVHVFDLLRHELTIDMILCGATDISVVPRDLVLPVGPVPI